MTSKNKWTNRTNLIASSTVIELRRDHLFQVQVLHKPHKLAEEPTGHAHLWVSLGIGYTLITNLPLLASSIQNFKIFLHVNRSHKKNKVSRVNIDRKIRLKIKPKIGQSILQKSCSLFRLSRWPCQTLLMKEVLRTTKQK